MQPVTSSRLRVAPAALILDYGGIIVSTASRPTGLAELAAVADTILRRAGVEVPMSRLEQSLRAGVAALKDYNNVSSRRREPVELTHHEIVTDFLVSDLPDRARLVLGADAAHVCRTKIERLSEHTLRPGVRDLLELARQRGIRVGIASNAQSGAAHRAVIEKHGLSDLIDVQLYSDEFGMRKPHPALLRTVAAALNAPFEQTWYVGDTRDRDLLAGRRAGMGAVVLIRHHNTDTPAYPVQGEPEAVFDEVSDLAAALRAASPRPAVRAATSVRDQDDLRGRPDTGATGGQRIGRPVRSGLLRRPRALLLDNGGVITISRKNPDAVRQFAAGLGAQLRRAGHRVGDDASILRDIQVANKRHETWKNEHDAGYSAPALTPSEFWGDLVAARWPDGARAAVLATASELTYEFVRCRADRTLLPGITAVLDSARANGIALGVVSNSICGQVARENHAAWGIAEYVGVSFYSDEFGYRKPDPSIVTACAAALGVDPADCWFVGDKPGRDTEAARRAGIGTAIVITSRATEASHGPAPDRVVRDAAELLAVLREAIDPAIPE